jgi:1-deoxy-D-xylulose 5-phosphate reductoisomerase
MIGEMIETVLQSHDVKPAGDLETVLAADSWARDRGEALCYSR